MQPKNPDISIVIVNYKTPQLLYTCIHSIFEKSSGFSFEIIVVDNDSQDESEQLITTNFPSVVWINMGYNAGFSKANNRGFAAAKGNYLLLLNSDTELYENCIYKTWQHYQTLEKTHSVGFVSCKVQSHDYSLQPNCNYYYPGIQELLEENPFVILVWVRGLKKTILRKIDKYARLNENHEVVWLGVPFAMINAAVKQQKNLLFDEDFFMYSEDKEWNYRLAKKGYHHFLYSETGVFHHNGGSAAFQEKRYRQINVSKWLFLLKSKGKLYTSLYLILLCNNLWIDGLFYRLAKLKGKRSDNEDLLAAKRRLQWQWLFKYGPGILFRYKKKYSSAPQPLNTYPDPL